MSVRKRLGIKGKGNQNDPARIFDAALNLHESGRFQDAYPLYVKALEGFETFLKRDTANIQFQSYVAMTQDNLGTLLRDMGRLEEAKTRYEHALVLYEELLKSDTANTQFQSDVATTQNNLGTLLSVRGRREEAKTRYERALVLREKLLKSDPANTQFQSNIAGTQNNLGTLLNVMGRLEEAKTRYEHALVLYEKLLKSDPANSQFQSYVATTQNNLGILLSDMGRLEEAKTRYERALELVKEQKNQHGTGRTLALLGILELERDDPETARTFLESSIGKLNKDIRPIYPNALNLLALCYFKIGERKKKAARREKRGENARRRQVSESSQFFGLAAERYREAYELPYARMSAELLIDACLADAFASSVQTVSEEDDQRAVELLNESIEKVEEAFEPAKKDEGQRKRVEGVQYDLLAKRCIRSVSLFKGEKGKEKQEELLVEASDNLLRAARNFEELESDKTAASCQGCACLYAGLKKFKDGILSDKFKLIAEAHDEFKNAASFYKNAESEVGEDVISTINEVMSEMEGSYDKWEGRKPGIADYLSIFDKISNLIEQVSAVGLKSMFKVYVFDEFMNLMDERRMKIKEGNIYAGEVVMGDKFENIRDSTIINKSVVENSFNKIRAEHGEEVASALKEIADFIEQQGNREAGELFDRFNEELNKPEPKKSVLKSVWAGIEKAIPVATALAEPVAKLATLFK